MRFNPEEFWKRVDDAAKDFKNAKSYLGTYGLHLDADELSEMEKSLLSRTVVFTLDLLTHRLKCYVAGRAYHYCCDGFTYRFEREFAVVSSDMFIGELLGRYKRYDIYCGSPCHLLYDIVKVHRAIVWVAKLYDCDSVRNYLHGYLPIDFYHGFGHYSDWVIPSNPVPNCYCSK